MLNYLGDMSNWMACNFVATFGDSISSVFKLIQGGSQGVSTMVDLETGDVPSPATSVSRLIATLERMGLDVVLEESLSTLKTEALEHLEHIKELELSYKNLATSGVPAFMQNGNKNIESAIAKLRMIAKTALAAMNKCAGKAKLTEAVTMLKVKDAFALADEPVAIPAGDSSQLRKLLGVDKSEVRTAYFNKLAVQWNEHRAAWKPPTAVLTPATVHKYWAMLDKSSPELSALARHHLLRPVSSACAERVFSYLTAMDQPGNQRTSATTLRTLLMLRGNRPLMESVLDDQAAVTAAKPQANTARQAEAAKRAREGADEAVRRVLQKRDDVIDVSDGSGDEVGSR